jgi:hypothetical protein
LRASAVSSGTLGQEHALGGYSVAAPPAPEVDELALVVVDVVDVVVDPSPQGTFSEVKQAWLVHMWSMPSTHMIWPSAHPQSQGPGSSQRGMAQPPHSSVPSSSVPLAPSGWSSPHAAKAVATRSRSQAARDCFTSRMVGGPAVTGSVETVLVVEASPTGGTPPICQTAIAPEVVYFAA